MIDDVFREKGRVESEEEIQHLDCVVERDLAHEYNEVGIDLIIDEEVVVTTHVHEFKDKEGTVT